MCPVNEQVISRVVNAIDLGIPVDEIVDFLARNNIVGYDAFLAVKAAEVSIRMRDEQ